MQIVQTAKDPNGYWFVLVDDMMDCDIPYSNTEAECLQRAQEAYPDAYVLTTADEQHYSRR